MLIPTSPSTGAMIRNLAPCVLPAAKSLLAHLTKKRTSNKVFEPKTSTNNSTTSFASKSTTTYQTPSRSKISGCDFFAPKIFARLGMPVTGRIIGPSVLHYILRRNMCSTTKISDGDAPVKKTMVEPYAFAINSMESEFLKFSYMKIHEEEFWTIFSDGLYKVAIRREPGHPHNEYFIDRNNYAHSIRRLKFQFNSDEENHLETQARKAIINKYGLSNHDALMPATAEGLRAYAMFDIAQLIKFLEMRQEELCKLLHPSDEMLVGAVEYTFKPSERSILLDQEHCDRNLMRTS